MTFVVGTTGDDTSDRAIAGQVGFIRALLFPGSAVLTDTDALAIGPDHAVVYGGPHVNAFTAKLVPCLPFELSAGHLEIGGQKFDDDEHVIVAVIPELTESGVCPHPELMLFAGTGTPGIAEINASGVMQGHDEPITIADAFGRLTGGTWTATGAKLEPLAPRAAWSRVQVQRAGVTITIAQPEGAQFEAAVDASLRGVEAAVNKLEIDGTGLSMTIYVHRDQAAKKAATGDGGAGHAVAYARALHVIGNVPAEGLELLVSHEATHLITPQAWGPAGSSLFGEGIAIWVSGHYAGVSLAEWNKKFDRTSKIIDLMGPAFRTFPEKDAYPAAGLIVEALISTVGLPAFRDHLLPATLLTWPDACAAAGTTPEKLDAAVAAHLAR